jgi:hypothetical protein
MDGRGYFGEAGTVMDTNFLPARNVYPGASGGTLATLGDAGSPDAAVAGNPANTGVATPARGGNPLTWWLGMAVLVALIMFTARRTGDAGDFSNIRASTYNIALITFISVLGVTVLKVLAARTRNVPGLRGFSDIVIAV